jgi:uncharacterized protein (DUF2235 family)
VSKNIVLCLDGTWNGPDNKDKAGNQTPTNVQKLFEALGGSGPLAAGDDEKEFPAPATATAAAAAAAAAAPVAQVGKYIHGVGANGNALAHAVEGAVGLGLVARVVRGYTYLSRVYEPGDSIFILGFSRGAYTARSLAGFVTRQGLLDWNAMKLVAGSQESYSAGLAAWQQYKKTIYQNKGSVLQDLAQVVSALHDSFDLGLHPSPKLQFTGNVGITAVGVWDTVGALGIPDIEEKDGSAVRVDVFRFCDSILNANVAHGFHAVAIDEQRVDFTPSLWEARDGVVQVLFPGAHADIGGGYTLAESGLSNAGLAWMARQIASVGAQFDKMPAGEASAAAIQHQPWAESSLKMKTGPRQFPPGLRLSQRVLQRLAAGKVPVQLGSADGTLYRPRNIVNSYVMLDWSGAAPHVVVEP